MTPSSDRRVSDDCTYARLPETPHELFFCKLLYSYENYRGIELRCDVLTAARSSTALWNWICVVLYFVKYFVDVGTGPVTRVRAGDW